LLGSLLAKGESVIYFKDENEDVAAVLELIKALGAEVTRQDDRVLVRGGLQFNQSTYFVGESGLAARMFLPILAMSEETVLLYASGSLRKRKQTGIIDSLLEMGVDLQYTADGFPIYVRGPLRPGSYQLDASKSSQFLTGLLFALPLLHSDSLLQVAKLASRPYIDLTIQTLESFGVFVQQNRYAEFSIPGNQEFTAGSFKPEGDWSGAAFHIVAALLAGSAILHDLNPASAQGDKSILQYIPQTCYSWAGNDLHIKKAYRLPAFQADLSDTPDLFPPLTALAVHAQGTSILHGVGRLVNKESNRQESLIHEFSKLGAVIWSENDCLMIQGGSLQGGDVNSQNDHRIAMALAVAALKAEAPVNIQNAEAVGKSYPGFWADFLPRR